MLYHKVLRAQKNLNINATAEEIFGRDFIDVFVKIIHNICE